MHLYERMVEMAQTEHGISFEEMFFDATELHRREGKKDQQPHCRQKTHYVDADVIPVNAAPWRHSDVKQQRCKKKKLVRKGQVGTPYEFI